MALIVDQQLEFKHFCKICNKGFGCGRALGGHMRTHGLGEDYSVDDHMDGKEEDHTSDWEDNLAIDNINVDEDYKDNNTNNDDNDDDVATTNNKRMYELRTNPNRVKSTHVCENCDKEFLSWKLFLEHKNGKCTSDDANSIISTPHSDTEDYSTIMRSGGWSKRKRSMRAKVCGDVYGNNNNNNKKICPSSEEEDLARCLMLLSNAMVMVEAEESCASASRDDVDKRPIQMSFIVPPTNKAKCVPSMTSNKGLFECKACKKVFNSHQALGGHRASHKKVKGCFAAKIADDDVITTIQHDHETSFFPKFDPGSTRIKQQSLVPNCKRRLSKVHECSICHRVFSSGQALGGHKRCHWITSNSPSTTTTVTTTTDASSFFASKFNHVHQKSQRRSRPNNSEHIDLSLELNNLHASTFTNVVIDYTDRPVVRRDHGLNTNKKKNVWLTVDDEAESKVKLAKLSELKDINVNGNSSPWLQVGIGSTANVASHL
ncbi:Zinc finger protein ZAT3 [Linum perenne]